MFNPLLTPISQLHLSTLFIGGVSYGKDLFFLNGAKMGHIDLVTGVYDRDVVSSGMTNTAAITMVTASTAVIARNDTTEYVVDTALSNQTSISSYSGALSVWGLYKGQQIAGDVTSGVSMAVSKTSEKLVKFVASTCTLSQVTVAGSPGTTPVSIIVKPGGSYWIVGFHDGTIREVDASGAVSKTITLPFASNVVTGAAPTTCDVLSLAMSDNLLMASTSDGIFYVYDYPSSTLLQQQLVGILRLDSSDPYLRGGLTLSNFASGFGASARNRGPTVPGTSPIATVCTGPSGIYYADMQSMSGNEVATDFTHTMGFEPTVNRLWAMRANTLVIFATKTIGTSTVNTQIHVPAGTVAAGRIIRIKDLGIGLSYVEHDQEIEAADTAINASRPGSFYEIGLNEDSSSFDWRTFNV